MLPRANRAIGPLPAHVSRCRCFAIALPAGPDRPKFLGPFSDGLVPAYLTGKHLGRRLARRALRRCTLQACSAGLPCCLHRQGLTASWMGDRQLILACCAAQASSPATTAGTPLACLPTPRPSRSTAPLRSSTPAGPCLAPWAGESNLRS